MSQSVVSGMAPSTELEHYFYDLMSQPHPMQLVLSPEAAGMLFASARSSYATLFETAAVEASKLIQRHWRSHMERAALAKSKDDAVIVELTKSAVQITNDA